MTAIERAIEGSRPAGGDDPSRFDWREAWYPVAYLRDLPKGQPTPFPLLGEDLVIWWDGQQWRAFADRCPHRLARLSEGRIAEDGLLECPYHGWAFQGDGTCDRIPQQKEEGTAHLSPRACARAYATATGQGMLFVYGGETARAARVPLPLVEPMEDFETEPPGWTLFDTFRDVPYDALTLLENVLDPSHLPFTHHRSVGNRSNAGPVELELQTHDRQGFTGFWAEGPRRGKLGSQATRFVAPCLMWHDLTSKQLGRTLTVVYATPMGKGQCRLFARFPFQFASPIPALFIRLTPRWYSHIGQNGVLEDDQIFLHYQERYLAAAGGSARFAKAFYLPTRADFFVTALRQWVNDFAGEPFPEEPFPPSPPRDVLLERYRSHTQHCRSCREALQTVERGQQGAIALGLMALAVYSGTGNPWAVGGVALAAIAWYQLGRLAQQFRVGRAVPPRNR
jgi:phenylpropionate dioxygenase-like ring-hydroxylating dioxygenase large terminal subunit